MGFFKDNVAMLKDTLYVPNLRSNWISIAKIVDCDHEVTFKKKCAVVTDEQGKVKLVADRIGDLFYIREQEQQAHAVSEAKSIKSEIETWHTRLGHLNARDLSKLIKNADCIKLEKAYNEIKCESCITGKMSSAPFGKRENFTS